MSTLPAKRPRAATEQDVLGALVALGSLPKRETDQAELDLAAYRVALDGVAAAALAKAVREILQGGLGHGFYPSPPELRLRVDQVVSAGAAATVREQRVQRQLRERRQWEQRKPSDESKARVAAMVEAFKRGIAPERGAGG